MMNRRLKKASAVLLAMTMIFSLAGCVDQSQGKKSSDSGTVKVWTRKRKNCVSYNSVIGCCVRNIDARIHERNKVCTECKAYIESDR